MGLEVANGVYDGHPGRNGVHGADRNRAPCGGGGIGIYNSRVHVIDCSIRNCFSHMGGGAHVLGGQFHVRNSHFVNNSCGHHGAGLLVWHPI